MTRDRLGALKAAQSEDEQDDDMQMDTGNAQYMEEFFEQVCFEPNSSPLLRSTCPFWLVPAFLLSYHIWHGQRSATYRFFVVFYDFGLRAGARWAGREEGLVTAGRGSALRRYLAGYRRPFTRWERAEVVNGQEKWPGNFDLVDFQLLFDIIPLDNCRKLK